MAIPLVRLRKLLAIDPNDPLSRFAVGKKLAEAAGSEEAPDDLAAREEAAEHLTVANQLSPEHLATYHILGETLIKLGRMEEAARVLDEGISRAELVTEGMGKDLAPLMRQLRDSLP